MTPVVLTPNQVKWLFANAAKGQASKVAIEDTNLTGIIGATLSIGRSKRTYLIDKNGKEFELIKKARK